ncbi:MAG: alpha-ketoglutarate-dependent dioxygenase AlkB [Aureispira sp.]|nr:alpha-ketoglutarate-dependent dioxygenase AlkB [Aureispira sp.]
MNLFNAFPAIPDLKGLQYIPDFITNQEQKKMLQSIDHATWLDDLKRRVQHYGYKYDYRKRNIDRSMRIGSLPKWSSFIINRLLEKGIIDFNPDQLIINEYEPGQGILAHIDCEPCFEQTILSLTLNSACLMHFINKADNTRKEELYLAPKSLLIMSDEARYQWKHGIVGRKTDKIEGQRIPRQRRVSLTFRKVILDA